jgi:hypothetical protein
LRTADALSASSSAPPNTQNARNHIDMERVPPDGSRVPVADGYHTRRHGRVEKRSDWGGEQLRYGFVYGTVAAGKLK